jgi:hypothetical protein
MTDINLLLNYYIENSYLNLNNNISNEDILNLINNIKKYKINITNINIPHDFVFLEIINKEFKDVTINFY